MGNGCLPMSGPEFQFLISGSVAGIASASLQAHVVESGAVCARFVAILPTLAIAAINALSVVVGLVQVLVIK